MKKTSKKQANYTEIQNDSYQLVIVNETILQIVLQLQWNYK